MSIIKSSLLTAVLLLSLVARTAIETYSNRVEGDTDPLLTTNNDLYDDKYFDMLTEPFWSVNYSNYKVTNFVRLGINPSVLQNVTYSGSVDVLITYHVWNNVGGVFDIVNENQTLFVNYDINGFNLISDQSSFVFSDAHYINVQILSINGLNEADLFIESQIEVERYYTMNLNQVSFIGDQPVPTGTTYSGPNNEFIELSWSFHPGAESYELEWVHINNYDVVTNPSGIIVTPKSINSIEYNFYLNSTRIEICENSYQVPNIFDKGYFLYRVRPISKSGSDFTQRNEGDWSAPESGIIGIDHPPTNLFLIDREYERDLIKNLNWGHQVAYTENGKRFESVSFVDGLGRGRQTVAKNTATDQVVVSNVYYDELGRPVISDLPTPVDQQYPRHFPNFNRADEPSFPSYNQEYFDLLLGGGNCNLNSKGMSDEFGAAKYYSTNNPDQDGENAYIPDAENFPFSRITYKDDFTGRVDRIASQGNTLKMGSGKETRMIYVSPSQTELNQLFGVEVGWASHYQKMVTVDPNGQVYVQYTDLAGRTVATYMTGESPANLQSLDDADLNQSYENTILDGSLGQGIDLNEPSATLTYTQYFTEATGVYTFDYSFTAQQYQDACLVDPTCFDCVYDLSISIVEECGTVINIPTPTVTINGEDLDAICNGTIDYEFPLFSVEIPRGVYTITKKLEVNKASIDEYWCMYLDNLEEQCLPPVSTLFNDLYANESFVECIDEIPQELVEETDCEVRRQLMLENVSPGGQYAVYTITNNGSYSTTDVTSIFHSTNTSFWQNANYVDANGSLILVDDGVGNMISPGQLPLEEFINQFDSQWADSLIDFHPESCFLDFCAANAASYLYDQAMLDTYTYAQACSLGYIIPLGYVPSNFSSNVVLNACNKNSIDPFFDNSLSPVPLGAPYFNLSSPLGTINESLDNYILVDGVYIDLWTYIAGLIYNPNATTSDDIILAGLNFSRDIDPDFDRDCYLDLFWVQFRSTYLDLKQQYYQQAQEQFGIDNNCPPVGAIGMGVGTGVYGEKTPIFPSMAYANSLINQTSTNNGGSGNIDLNSLGAVTGFVNGLTATACDDACTDYAQEWLDKLSQCNINPSDEANLLAAFKNICMNGCDEQHMGGASTPNPNSVVIEPITGLTNPTIQQVLTYYGYAESTLCTDLLISEPMPYDNASNYVELFNNVPLDTCGCDVVYQAQLDLVSNPNVVTLEEMLFINTGLDMADADYILCACDKYLGTTTWTPDYIWGVPANNDLIQTGIEIPLNLSCAVSGNGTNCTDCDAINIEINDLVTQFGNTDPLIVDFESFLLAQNSAIILTNYLNDELNFNLNYTKYIDFIRGCRATPSEPYCSVNPLAEQLNDVLKLIAFKGQLISTGTIDLELENIVYATSDINDVVGQYYSSVLVGNQLTSTFSDGNGNSCDYIMSLPAGSDFGFEDIYSFNAVFPSSFTCDGNYGFQIEVSYLSCGILTTGVIDATSTCFEINLCICGDEGQTLCDNYDINTEAECYQPYLDQMYQNALEQYQENVTEKYVFFVQEYKAKCAEAFDTELFKYSGPDRYYQFTLFYYDQAGNLVNTIAPKGNLFLANVNNTAIDADRASVQSSTVFSPPTPGITIPLHEYKTEYKYNSYNQLIATTNPDQEGSTSFWYDRFGRIVASQNPVQALANMYSYTFYDVQGRPVEVGQVTAPIPLTNSLVKDPNVAQVFPGWVSTGARSEVTQTQYDRPLNTNIEAMFASNSQQNLRLRVASVFYFVTEDANGFLTAYESATHYSYDLHGNVIEQIQDVPVLSPVEQDIKSTQYEFELISGNVKKVNYQKGELDQMTHEYCYDDLNRLIEVFTSKDDVHKSREAHYKYYDYGPLARTEIGQHKVQGCDFAYTINGWLKAVNGSTNDISVDMGIDGNNGYLADNTQVHNLFAQDVVSYSLGYFENDYTAISGNDIELDYTNSAFNQMTANPVVSNSLYNGNIRHSVTSIYGSVTQGANYSYDQLQRLKDMTVFYNVSSTNSWQGMLPTQEYYNAYSYDQNGNIESLQRNGTLASNSLFMDQFTYNYFGLDNVPNTTSAMKSNRLNSVLDSGVDDGTSTVGDIKNGQAAGNYTYDQLGQLIGDDQENIQEIIWRKGDKKMLEIKYLPSSNISDLEFKYNPFGIRILKIEKTKTAGVINAQDQWKYTYYSHDANGQTMAIYDVSMGVDNKAYLAEQHIYGASRLGLLKRDKILYDNGMAVGIITDVYQHLLGERRYEITNHLGNVNAVISDRKVVATIGSPTIYQAVATMTANYYPFGMKMPEACNGGTQNVDVESYNLVSEQNFDTGLLGGWAGAQNGSVAIIANQLEVTAPLANDGAFINYAGLTPASEYRVRFDLDYGSSNGELQVGYLDGGLFVAQNFIEGTNNFTFTGLSSTLFVVQYIGAGGPVTFTLDNVSLQEVITQTVAVACIGFINESDYRFGFNGMEVDNEVSGIGNSYTTQFRQYDPRLGRWKSLDPLMSKFPWMSPYVGFDNNPIIYTDPYGLNVFQPNSDDGPNEGGGAGDKGGPKMTHRGWDVTPSLTILKKGVGGMNLNIPVGSNPYRFHDNNKDGILGFPNGTPYKGASYNYIESFNGQNGNRYNASFNKDGSFRGYRNSQDKEYDNKRFGKNEIFEYKLDQAFKYLGNKGYRKSFEAPMLYISGSFSLSSFSFLGEKFDATISVNGAFNGVTDKFFDRMFISETDNNHIGQTMAEGKPQIQFFTRYDAPGGAFSRDGEMIMKITFNDIGDLTRFMQLIHLEYGIDDNTPLTSKSLLPSEVLPLANQPKK